MASSSVRSSVKKLSKKLQEKTAPNPRVKALKSEIPDIEDVVQDTEAKKSPFFSPLKTRGQRRKNAPTTVENNIPSVAPNILKQNKSKAVENVNKKVLFMEDEKPDKPWNPKHWEEVLRNVRQMRSSTAAPVDTMGCHKCSDENADVKTQRFQKLVALMLSSQTKDETTFAAMQRLKSNTLSPEVIVAMSVTDLEDLLRPVSFYKNKAKHIQQTARILIDKYSSDIPNNVKELVALPGVGPKMAHICMATAWDKVTGIGVDVHVHRIVNRLRWVQKATKEPEKTRIALEKWLPQDLWREVNHLLVGFGQTVCTPVSPHCGECLNRDICPSADKCASKKIKIIELDRDIWPIKIPKLEKE